MNLNMSQFQNNMQMANNSVAFGYTQTSNTTKFYVYQQVGTFIHPVMSNDPFNQGVPIDTINDIKVTDFCGNDVPFTVSFLKMDDCQLVDVNNPLAWTEFVDIQSINDPLCLTNTMIRIAVLNMSVQIWINGYRQWNFVVVPTAGLVSNLYASNCNNQFNYNGVNIYGRMNCVQDLYNTLSYTITCSLGLDCIWFHTEPNIEPDISDPERGINPTIGGYFDNEDYVFHEYRFSSVTGVSQFRVLLPEGAYPNGKIEYDPFDIQFEKPFTVEVNRRMFAEKFGPEAVPLPTDYVYFPMLNRAYSVNEMYKKDEDNFLYNNSMFTCELQMYSNDTTVNKSKAISAGFDLDSALGNYDDFFGQGQDIQSANAGINTSKAIGEMDYNNTNYELDNKVIYSDYESIKANILCHDGKQFTHFMGVVPANETINEPSYWHKEWNVTTCNDDSYYISIIFNKKINELYETNYKRGKSTRDLKDNPFEHNSVLTLQYKNIQTVIDTTNFEDDTWYCVQVAVDVNTMGTETKIFRYNKNDLSEKNVPYNKQHLMYKFFEIDNTFDVDNYIAPSECNPTLDIEYNNEIVSYAQLLIAKKPDIAPKPNTDIIFRDVLSDGNVISK